ncbi:hypothetical protein GCK32_008419 [Trichostrongylus colubriformis]|uniref:Uncharacterized protein n=1 Tax=Trichostrongylus colubriformis TaxID=6319 RepID=A0AAN8FM97_TRICO
MQGASVSEKANVIIAASFALSGQVSGESVDQLSSFQVSEYEPDSNELEWSSEEDCVGETNPKAYKKYFMVKGSMLMKLFRYCPRCGHRIVKAQLKAMGTAAVVRLACEGCLVRVGRWESQERAVGHSRERLYRGNVVAAVSAITTGVRHVVSRPPAICICIYHSGDVGAINRITRKTAVQQLDH